MSFASLATAATSLSNLILVTPNTNQGIQPQDPPTGDGVVRSSQPTILFNYEAEQTVSLQSDITDHYVEDNTSLQDNIALRPEVITTSGFIGELNDIPPNQILNIAKIAATRLLTVQAYTPALTVTALLKYNQAAFAASTALNVANSAIAAWNAITGKPTQNKQQLAYQQFYGYWKNRTLFTVQTPWQIFQNCAIQSLRAVQDAETRMITNFEVTFKVMRFASTTLIKSALSADNFQGRSAFPGDLNDYGTGTTGPSKAFATSGVA